MIDDNWELIEGDAAHAIEVLNYANQVNVIEALVHWLMHHHSGEDGTCQASPSEVVLREFHRTATLFLLQAPGEYRDCPVEVRAGATVIHTPPSFEDVPNHISQFFETVRDSWNEKTAQEIAAFCLWFINWVHPFKNGNGRTARAFCYACLCLKLGFVLPGRKTVIDLIMEQREEYYRILGETDKSFEASGMPDLSAMTDFVDRLLAEQLTSI
jgi:Fic family protein